MFAHGCQVTPASFVEKANLFHWMVLVFGHFVLKKKVWPHIEGTVCWVGLRRWGCQGSAVSSRADHSTTLPSCSFLIVQCHSWIFIGHFTIQKCFCWSFITILGETESSPEVQRGFDKSHTESREQQIWASVTGMVLTTKAGLGLSEAQTVRMSWKPQTLWLESEIHICASVHAPGVAVLPTFSKDSWTTEVKTLNLVTVKILSNTKDLPSQYSNLFYVYIHIQSHLESFWWH